VEIHDDNASTALKREILGAFSGFAKMSFGDNTDLHRGPKFTAYSINNRQPSKKRRDQFVTALGGDPSDPEKPLTNLNRFAPEHAITILVPKKYVDVSSLVSNPLDPAQLAQLQHVKFVGIKDAPNAVGEIANGSGRIDFIRNFLAFSLVSEYQRVEKAILSQPSTVNMEKLIQRRTDIIERASEPTEWGIALYDKGQHHYNGLPLSDIAYR
jgi:hypothetical protein